MKLKDIRNELHDLRSADLGRLNDEVTRLKKEQFNLRFQQATGQLENVARMREVRRQLARVKTLIAQKAPPASV